eukprot:TRINITY_DN1347_c0_g1_i2.p3 TRINITY_DN1347_c0_g1~~TRINITY_DN1347_c0_g1_i2.p3  ORF type:complete len:187 (+),score=46.95 TRINITY_DN1347_c0_g1_i2:24-563(+)
MKELKEERAQLVQEIEALKKEKEQLSQLCSNLRRDVRKYKKKRNEQRFDLNSNGCKSSRELSSSVNHRSSRSKAHSSEIRQGEEVTLSRNRSFEDKDDQTVTTTKVAVRRIRREMRDPRQRMSVDPLKLQQMVERERKSGSSELSSEGEFRRHLDRRITARHSKKRRNPRKRDCHRSKG